MKRLLTKHYNRSVGAIGFLLFLLSIVACQSQSLRVESDPAGADVVVSAAGLSPRKVGVTPYVLQPNDQGDRSQALQVSVIKDSFVSESVLLAPNAVGRTGSLFFKLDGAKLPAACMNQEASLEKVSRGVAEAQFLIKSKNFDQAERSLAQLTTEYQNVSVLHELMGNIHFLRRDLDRALSSYRRSLSIAPNNSDTSRMIKRLEEMRGGSR